MSARRYLPPAEMRHALIQGPWRTRSLDERMTGRFPRRLPKKDARTFPGRCGNGCGRRRKGGPYPDNSAGPRADCHIMGAAVRRPILPVPARRKDVMKMLSIHKTIDKKMTRLDAIQDGCWINLTYPTEDELNTVSETLNVDPGFLRAALDEEETSRIDTEDDQTLIIIDVPAVEKDDAVVYSTIPLGIIVTGKHIITVCLKESSIVKDFQDGLVKNAETQKRTRFILYMLLQVAKRFLQYLKQIDKIYNYMERHLYKSQRNKELIQLLDLEKSLVYFNTSLKANEGTLEKILRGRIITLYEEDHDLLEDVLIEVRQAIEMANIYSSIISGMMDAFASVISNNLNVIMKVLTSITVLLTVPNIIFGFYGMNITAGLPLDQFWWIPLILAVAVIAVVALILKKHDLF